MADKKISELPLITTISGSIVYVPIVHDGITEKITVEDFSKFTNKYAAQTGSANIFTANQTINANLLVSGDSTISSNATIGGNLVVNGKLTAQELHTEITSASIIFESGSTIFGNSADDTHQFTGVVSINGISIGAGVINDFTASQLANDVRMLYITGALNSFTQSQIGKDGTLAEVTSSLRYFYQTTASLHAFTSSQIGKDDTLAVVTSSLNAFTASQLGQANTLSTFTSSINAFTGSQIGKDGTLAEVTSSLRYFYQTTSSLHEFTASQIGKDETLGLVTSSLNDFTQSQIGKDGTLALVTSSLNNFTQSQIGKDFTLSIVTSSLNNYTSSIIGQSNTIAVFTSSINAFTGSQLGKDLTLSIVTSSIDAHILKQSTQTGSQDLINYQNSIITSSYRIELNSIEAYTSSLKSAIIVNGTNVQIVGELDVARLNVQYVSSSVLVTSGSNTFGDTITDKHEFTGSVAVRDGVTGSFKGNLDGTAYSSTNLVVQNASSNANYALIFTTAGVNGNLTGYTDAFGGMLYNPSTNKLTVSGSVEISGSINVYGGTITGSILATNGVISGSSQLPEIAGLQAYTASLKAQSIVSSSTQVQNYDVFALNSNLYESTGSIKAEIAGIEAYTASLKAQSIVSSSTQIQNYDVFALNSNLYNGTGSLIGITNGLMALTASMKAAAIVSSSQQIQNYNLFAVTSSANIFYNYQAISGSKLELHTSDANGGLVINSKATATQTFITLLDRGTNDNSVVATFEDTNGSNQLGGLKIEAGRKDNQAGIILKGKNKVANSGAVNGYITSVIGNAYSDNALTTLTTGVTGKSISFLGQDTELANLNFNGDLTITNGNLVVASGKGIDFSVTSDGSGTTSSELLNDYEEGTWTPVIRGSSTNGTYTLSGGSSAYYTKIGNQVTVYGTIGFSAASGGAGYMEIASLPFTYKANTGAVGQFFANNFDFSAGTLYAVILTTSSGASTNLFVAEVQDNGVNTEAPISGVTTSTTFKFTFTYTVS